MSNAVWGILAFVGNAYMVLHKDGSRFVDDVTEAKQFDTQDEANLYAMQIKTPTIVQLLVGVAPKSNIKIPHPDFYESGNEYMTLPDLLDMISSEDLTREFIPVDKITGGQQMTGCAIFDPYNGQIVGREIAFSFSRLLKDDEMEELRIALSQDTNYSAASYVIKRLGFTAYAVLTLRVKRQ